MPVLLQTAVLAYLRAVCIVALLALPIRVDAVDADNSEALSLQEVTVTATRQGAQSLQTVPMAVSVVSPSNLDQQGLSGLTDLARTLPSVNMQAQSPGVTSIEMRGLVTNAPDITTVEDRSLTAVYLDDIPIGVQTANPDLHVYDLESIEVIRGPQGTLYGAGSMAGTIRMITKKPDTTAFSLSTDFSESETDHGGPNYSLRASANIPLTDTLAARVAAYRSQDSGFIDNIGLNAPRANDAVSTQGRAAIRWTPSSSFTLDASVIIAKLTAHGDYDAYTNLCTYCFTSLEPERFDDNFKAYNVTADWTLSFGHLIASASYLERQFDDTRSFDFFAAEFINPGALLATTGHQNNHVSSPSEELRLVSRQDQRLRWVVGAFRQDYHRHYDDWFAEPGFDAYTQANYGFPPNGSEALYGTPGPDTPFWGPTDIKEHQTAIFGEVTYGITQKLDVTLGARYFDFHQDFNYFSTGIAGAQAPGLPLTRADGTTESGANPRFVASYKLSDETMVFAQAARGFRYGGVNIPISPLLCPGLNSPATFGPDHLWDYDLGEKSTFVNNRLRVNATAFYIDWRNAQITQQYLCGYPQILNTGRLTSEGAELETQAKVTEKLTLSLSGSYTHAYTDNPILNTETGLTAPSGSRVPYFPRAIVTAGAEYSVPVGAGAIQWALDGTYRSYALTDFNPQSPTARDIPSSFMLNGSVTYSVGKWELALYGTNLTNNLLISTYEIYNVPALQPGDKYYIGRPRTVGLRIHFGL
jgi:outer membrane receptor protein involved in Fe transport